jgi:hypothetical protein
VPRHTHPAPRNKHARAHTREYRDRYALRRWKQIKARHGFSWHNPDHPEVVARQPTSGGRHANVDPNNWPFYLTANQLTRNPFTRCSCLGCTWPKNVPGRRARERQSWLRDIDHADEVRTPLS